MNRLIASARVRHSCLLISTAEHADLGKNQKLKLRAKWSAIILKAKKRRHYIKQSHRRRFRHLPCTHRGSRFNPRHYIWSPTHCQDQPLSTAWRDPTTPQLQKNRSLLNDYFNTIISNDTTVFEKVNFSKYQY